MLKRLRKKIILINMITVGLVLICVFTVFCANSYHSSKEELMKGLMLAAGIDHREEQFRPEIGGPQRPDKGSFAFVSVYLDSDGEIFGVNDASASMDGELLSEAVRLAAAAEEEGGTLASLGLMYSRRVTPEGSVIVFGDTGSLTASLRRNVLVSALLFALSFGALFLISLWLSGFAVRPIAEAWTRQKQFIADASHELKTPLTVILANNNILLEHRADTIERQSQWLTSSDEEAKRMKGLIDQMLLLAKTDTAEAVLALSEVSLSEVVEERALSFEPVAYERGITIQTDVAGGIGLKSDAAMLGKLVGILLDNAIKYASPGSSVSVRLERRGREAEFEVTNFGSVISKEELPHIFDRFYRTDKARSEGGFGLGLAIASSIAESLRARISAESGAETGTTFRVIFPDSF